MKYLKKFNEMFDTEDIKSRHEIDFLSGRLKNIGKNVDQNFKDEEAIHFTTKLSMYNFPFFKAFITSGEEEGLGFDGFSVHTSDDIHYNAVYLVTSDKYTVAMCLKINKVDNYNVFIYLDDRDDLRNTEKNPGVNFDGLTYNQLCDKIKEFFIPFIKQAGFGDLLKYNEEENINNN
jgi:hypothetical protein